MPTYRLEEASTSRAGCQNKECKDAKIKIQKGELRVGSWVDTEKYQSWVWRHWGCTTPKVIANMNDVVEEGSAKLEKDLTVIDGFEELSPENQERVREALDQGHVADEDWKGDVELNRPGKAGFRKRLSKKEKDAAAAAAEKDEDEASEKEEPAKKTKKKRGQNGADADVPASQKPKRASRAKKAAEPEPESEPEPASEEEEEEKPEKTTRRGRAAKTAAVEDAQPKKAATTRKRKTAAEDSVDAVSEEKTPKRGKKAATIQDEGEKPQRGRGRKRGAATA